MYIFYLYTLDRNISQEMVAVGLYDIRSKAISFNTGNPITWPGKNLYLYDATEFSLSVVNKKNITCSNVTTSLFSYKVKKRPKSI